MYLQRLVCQLHGKIRLLEKVVKIESTSTDPAIAEHSGDPREQCGAVVKVSDTPVCSGTTKLCALVNHFTCQCLCFLIFKMVLMIVCPSEFFADKGVSVMPLRRMVGKG